MKLPPGGDIGKFMEIRFNPGAWENKGLPTTGCRIRTSTFNKIIRQGGSCDIEDLIYGLMDWLDVTDEPKPALDTVQMILDRHFPADDRTSAKCQFQDENGFKQTFHIGPVAIAGDIIAWQRLGWVIALAQACEKEPGRIVVAAPAPISLRDPRKILALGQISFMMEPFDSYIGAKTMSASTANFYAWEAGEATTCHWPYELGKRVEANAVIDCSYELEDLPEHNWLAPNQLAMMVAIASGY